MTLTRNQRRQMEKLASHVERVTDTDCAFFEQHQDRRHRVRHACEAEIAQMEIMDGKVWHAPHGCRWFAIVRKVRSGQRIRIYVPNNPGAKTGLEAPASHKSAVRRDPTARIQGILNRVAMTTQGDRNKVLFWGAMRVVDMVAGREVPPSEGDRAFVALAGAAHHAGLSEHEIVQTLQSARSRA